MNELEIIKQAHAQLEAHFLIQYERIKKLEEAIRNHRTEMQNHMSNLEIDPRQFPDWDTNKKLWDLLFD